MVALHCGVLFTHVIWHQMCTVSVFIVATVTIDIERRVIDVIENQTFAEVCLVKSGPSSLPVMALVNAEELTGNAGSPGGRPFSVVVMTLIVRIAYCMTVSVKCFSSFSCSFH